MEWDRNDTTMTMGRTAHLFGFTESQLRNWEVDGLLERFGKEGKGHRQEMPHEGIVMASETLEDIHNTRDARWNNAWSGLGPTSPCCGHLD
jgi:hypothetical protein